MSKNTKDIRTEVQLRDTLTKLLVNLTNRTVGPGEAGKAVAVANSIFNGVKNKMKYDQLRGKKEISKIRFMEK